MSSDNRINGKFKKGVSGNPSGRPKNANLTQKDRNELKALIEAKDVSKLAAWLCERANTTAEAFKYIREFAPYMKPKLQSVKTETNIDKKITIEWQGLPTQVIEGKYSNISGELSEDINIELDIERIKQLPIEQLEVIHRNILESIEKASLDNMGME